MAIHIPMARQQVTGMPIDKIMDTINNHRNVSLGSLKSLWDGLPAGVRDSIAGTVEGWGDKLTGTTIADKLDKHITSADDLTPQERDTLRKQVAEMELSDDEMKYIMKGGDINKLIAEKKVSPQETVVDDIDVSPENARRVGDIAMDKELPLAMREYHLDSDGLTVPEKQTKIKGSKDEQEMRAYFDEVLPNL